MEEQIIIPIQRLSRSALSETQRRLVQSAYEIAQDAYAPYSHYSVGAAVLLDNGVVVTGSNQENAAYPSGICAERTALFYAGAQYPHSAVVAIAITAIYQGKVVDQISPCGACRQVLSEVSDRFKRPFEVILAGAKECVVLHDNRGLLPLTFDSSNL